MKKREIIIASFIVVVIAGCFTACTINSSVKEDQSTENTTVRSAVAEVDESHNAEDGSGYKSIADMKIIEVKANEIDITNDVDIEWLQKSIENSEITNRPEAILALDLDVELVFDNNESANLKALSEGVYRIIYENERYILLNNEITEWMLSIC